MNTLTKLALGLMGQLNPLLSVGDSEGLAAVIRAWFDRQALSQAMGLQADRQLRL